MGVAIGQMLPFAVGVAVSPMPIVAMILMLVTPRARTNGPAFLSGWIGGILILGAIVLLIVNPGASGPSARPGWTLWLKLVLGVLLVLLAVREWRSRPHGGEEAATPKWMGALDSFTPVKAIGAGAFLSALNPKNLLLVISGATVVAQAGISGGQATAVWILFTILATIGVGAPLVIYVAMGKRAAALLEQLKGWMAHNNAVIMAILCLIIGVKLIGDAISGLSA
ncbi:MAG: GAP family protein [Chloroflexi bacterium]|nr:GAP family protein [Chloroflexota bacterium]